MKKILVVLFSLIFSTNLSLAKENNKLCIQNIKLSNIKSQVEKDLDNKNNIFIRKGNEDKKVIALTFDDGPHPKETIKILDVLKKYDVCATFFVVGKHASWYSEPLIRAVKENHEIANHTFSHCDISKLNSYEIEKEIIEAQEIILEVTGKKTNLFRPPFGNYNKEILEEIAKNNGYKIILWATFDVMDWKNPSPEEIAQNIIKNASNGDIVLLHDYGTNNTSKALDIAIPKLIDMGFEFKTVSEIIK